MDITVIKRDGRRQLFQREKLYNRLARFVEEKRGGQIEVQRIVDSVECSIPSTINAEMVDQILAEKTAELAFVHPEYDVVAGRIEMDILKRNTPSSFSASCRVLSAGVSPVLSLQFMDDLGPISQYLDMMVDSSCSFPYTYSAMKSLEHTYLLRKDGKVIERPTYMFMRVALHLHRRDIRLITSTYEDLLHHAYIHSTPTMANAGTIAGQLSSCFILALDQPYTTEGLYRTLGHAAKISTSSGGIGMDFTGSSSVGSKCSSRPSLGLPPVMKLFDSSLAVDVHGQNRRPAAITAYLEVWHGDLLAFLNMRRNRSNNNDQVKNIFQALWVPDLFMSRVHNNERWSLFSPQDVPLLKGSFGHSFEAMYMAYEMDTSIPRVTRTAQSVMKAITEVQVETGGPFMLYKDSINRKNNQSNLGTITHSNLCTEVVQFSSPSETAVCNLASVILPTYVCDGAFDFDELHRVVETVTYNLNKVIDRTTCPSEAAIEGNRNQRAIGIGIQGLADLFIELGLPYDSRRAKDLNLQIMETIYYASVSASVDYARINGCYPSFAGSPLSQGQFQFDLWGSQPPIDRYNWDHLRSEVGRYGVANSLLIALMPTSGTSQITGCTESFEPIQSTIFTRHVLSGEYRVLSPALVHLLSDAGIWSEEIRTKIIRHQGSVQFLDEVPSWIKALFKTSWELGPKPVVDMAIDRGPYVCQSQSLSICMPNPNVADLTSFHFFAWRSGLKTGMYYLRTRPTSVPIQFSIPFSSYSSSSSASSQPSSSPSSVSRSGASHRSPSLSMDRLALLMQQRVGEQSVNTLPTNERTSPFSGAVTDDSRVSDEQPHEIINVSTSSSDMSISQVRWGSAPPTMTSRDIIPNTGEKPRAPNCDGCSG